MSSAYEVLNNLQAYRFPFDYDTVRAEVPSGYAGWYAIWVGAHCVYVGMSDGATTDVRGRLLRHLNRSHNPDLDDHIEYRQRSMYFSAVIAAPGENVKKYEAWLINQLEPSANSQWPDW